MITAPTSGILTTAPSDESIRILEELREVNGKMARRLTRKNVYWLSAADILAGSNDCKSGSLLNALYSCWSNDPVHGDRIDYAKLVMGI
jgi:hypothetical protein